MLSSSHARTIAEADWGKGGTSAYRTNRRGAFYFSCTGHGGFVIDAAALTIEERKAIEPYGTPQEYRLYGNKLWWPERRTKLRYSYSDPIIKGEYFTFEEDCAWCLPVIFAGIRVDRMTDEDAKRTFWHWFDRQNPEVARREKYWADRQAKSPDCIISCAGQGMVTTADGKVHRVTNYNPKINYLSELPSYETVHP